MGYSSAGRAALNGIQEVSGSIPLISRKKSQFSCFGYSAHFLLDETKQVIAKTFVVPSYTLNIPKG